MFQINDTWSRPWAASAAVLLWHWHLRRDTGEDGRAEALLETVASAMAFAAESDATTQGSMEKQGI